MTEQQARNRYDALCMQWRALDRCLTNITVFGNYRWTEEMLKARRILVAMLNTDKLYDSSRPRCAAAAAA